MWSVGVIVFAIMRGSVPFDGKDTASISGCIKQGDYTLPDGLSEPARDFITKLLKLDPGARLSAAEALKHPWVTVAHTSTRQLQGTHEQLEMHMARDLPPIDISSTKRGMALVAKPKTRHNPLKALPVNPLSNITPTAVASKTNGGTRKRKRVEPALAGSDTEASDAGLSPGR
jgi:serine/threonine protein kinase